MTPFQCPFTTYVCEHYGTCSVGKFVGKETCIAMARATRPIRSTVEPTIPIAEEHADD
jgi:hypothetical protein